MPKGKKTDTSEELKLHNPLYAEFLDFAPRKGDIRRARVLEATIRCIAELGGEKTNFESIGKRAGMLRAHVAYYYPDRDELVKAAIKFAVATAQHHTVLAVTQARTDEERLLAFIDGTYNWIEAYPEHGPVILLLYHYCSVDPFYRKIHTEAREMGAQRIEALLKPLLANAAPRELREKSKAIQALLTGHIMDFLSTNCARTLREYRAQTVAHVREHLLGKNIH